MIKLESYSLSPQQKYTWHVVHSGRISIVIRPDITPDWNRFCTAVNTVLESSDIYKVNFTEIVGQEAPLQTLTDIPAVSFTPPAVAGDSLLSVSLGDDGRTIRFAASPLCADIWSLGLLATTAIAVYEGRDLPGAAIGYLQYAEWIHQLNGSEDLQEGRLFWEERLSRPAGNPHLLFERTNGKAVTATYKPVAGDVEQVNDVILAAAWHLLLWKLNGEEDCAIGYINHGRSFSELYYTHGVFSSILPLQVSMPPDLLSADFVQRYQDECELADIHKDALNPDATFRQYVEAHLCYQFEYIDHCLYDNASRLVIEEVQLPDSPLKIRLQVHHTVSGRQLFVHYDRHSFSSSDIAYLYDAWLGLVQSLTNGNQQLTQLKLPGHLFRRKMSAFSHTLLSPSLSLSVVDLFRQQLTMNSGHVALVDQQGKTTYEELDRRATQVAGYLVQKELTGSTGILFTEHSELIVAMLAVLKAGGTYVPLDPKDAPRRLQHIITDAGISCVLTASGLQEILMPYQHITVLLVQDMEHAPEDVPLPVRTSDTPAYIIYTSGTSGLPKGVVITDESLVNYVIWAKNFFHLTAADSSVLLSSYAFDLGYTALWGTLLSGGTLHLLAGDKVRDMDFLVNYIVDAKVSFIKTTPSFFHVLIRSAEARQLSTAALRLIILGGEKIQADDLEWLHTMINPRITVANHYGPTESTIGTIAHMIDLHALSHYRQQPVIGKPISNNKVFILDDTAAAAAPGMPGEICVGGRGLAREYLNRPELTAERFTLHSQTGDRIYRTGDLGCWLPDGTILYLGRKDDQVKIRGYRVEPGEVKQVISQYPDIEQVVVTVREKELVAYFTAKVEVDSVQLRTFLKGMLPEYMVPADLVQLREIPLTANHKVDLKALPDPATGKKATVIMAENSQQQQVLDLWKQVLGKQEISIDDNFFDIGGHSLKAIQLANRLQKETGVKATLKDLFDYPTVRLFCQHITIPECVVVQEGIPAVPKATYYALSNAQKRIWLTSQRKDSSNIYNVPQLCLFKGALNVALLETAFARLIDRHESLRIVFRYVNGEPVQQVLDPATVHFSLEQVYATSKEALDEMIRQEALAPFDIEHEIGIRGRLIRTAEGHLLLFTLHHIISDGWSRAIMYRELLHFYEAAYYDLPAKLPPLKIQYKDYASWHTAIYKEQAAYWEAFFKKGIPDNGFPLDFRRPDKLTFEGNACLSVISEDELSLLRKMASGKQLTLNHLFMAAYGLLLSFYGNKEEVIVGTIVSGRDHADLENVIGVFINYLPVRIQIDTSKDLLTYVQDTARELLTTYQYKEYPFDLMVEHFHEQTNPARNPVFDTMLIFHEAGESADNPVLPGDVMIEGYEADTTQRVSKLDFKIDATNKGNAIEMRLEYNRNLFHEQSMQRLLDRFKKLLLTIATAPATSLKELQLIPEEELRSYQPLRLKVIASFTAEPLQDHLEWWLNEFEQRSEISFAGYHHVFQELMQPQSGGETCVILNRFEDYVQDRTGAQALETLEIVYQELIDKVTLLAKTCPVIFVSLPVDATHPMADHIERLNSACRNVLGAVDHLYLVNAGAPYAGQDIFDPVGYRNAKIPFTTSFFYYLGYHINRIIWGINGTPCKVIALDCDHTLWEGVCGEDSLSDIQIREGHRSLQEWMIRKYNEGFLLVLLSKNNEEDVWKVFSGHPGMLVKKEHFIDWRIDWNDKTVNIRKLATALNVGLDSFAFIDDNPVECERMMEENPQVLTLQLPADQRHHEQFLQHIIAFDKIKVSREDTERNKMYQSEKQRDELRKESNIQTFLQRLELELSIRSISEKDMERALQLLMRTNQFNLNGKRLNRQELERLIAQDNFYCDVIHVRDRFGDYGFVGLLIREHREHELLLHSFLLSCRVLGRGIEQVILSELKNICQEKNVHVITAAFVETSRNAPIRQFLESWGKQPQTGYYQIAVNMIPAQDSEIKIYRGQDLPVDTVEEKIPFLIDHIGIAVRKITDVQPVFQSLGFGWGPVVYDPVQSCRLTMGTRPDWYNVELVEGVGADDPLRAILHDSAAVPYHLCYRVKNHSAALAFLHQQGFLYEIIREAQPAVLFNHLKVLFLYQKDLGLIELIEDPDMVVPAAGQAAPVLQAISYDVEVSTKLYRLFGFSPAGRDGLLKHEQGGYLELLSLHADGETGRKPGPVRLVFPQCSLEVVPDYIQIRTDDAQQVSDWMWEKRLHNEKNLQHIKVYKALEFSGRHGFEVALKRKAKPAVQELPGTPLEQSLSLIFKEVLKLEHIGMEDDFFELGGHSIKAALALSRIYQVAGVEIPLTTFFEKSNVKALADFITTQKSTEEWLRSTVMDSSNYTEIIL
ncbi:non-ribosomal peptide synthetase [[Flexibacter] sp. ATCC 35208]|uniref:non-ribosomal peptide synthetase n=1 Tax=[Flexibacter] sp. ATCC 35208 TaxID=1936242 RepID=UPI0009D2050F|nr:non-ribosomal peptide synthetase [[Flexibacter] sp. ATCC 35208]OMP79330.1 hypothetical protein BW716_09515 [[Flexibacter] sp. ATCC 35208]